VTGEQPWKPCSRGAGRHDELAGAEREDFRARDTRRFHPAGRAHEYHEQYHRWREHGTQDHQEQQPRHRQHRIREAHQHAVEDAARVAGNAANHDADAAGDQSGK
jgi:hypothetical protein